MKVYGVADPVGRRRKPDPPVVVTLVLASGEESVLPAGSPLANAMGHIARLLVDH